MCIVFTHLSSNIQVEFDSVLLSVLPSISFSISMLSLLCDHVFANHEIHNCNHLFYLCSLQIMFSVVHFRCRAAGVRLTKTVSNSFPMSDISVLNVHTIATDVEIIRGSDAQVDRILIDVTMTAPDQKVCLL